MFYNTTQETNPELAAYRDQTLKQDARVLELFKTRRHLNYTPSEVLRIAFDRTPITSIRRSMTNLTDDGLLIKTGSKREGMYGRPEHVWALVHRVEQPELF